MTPPTAVAVGVLRRRAADLASAARAAAAVPFACLAGADPGSPGAVLAAVLFVLAAGSDFADGRLARRFGTASAAGTRLDHGADIVFLVAGFWAYAARGRIGWAIPGAVALSFAAYAGEAALRGERAGGVADRIGHAAGLVNWVFLGVLAVEGAAPGWAAALTWAAAAGAVLVVACAGAAIAARAGCLLRSLRLGRARLVDGGRGVVD